MHNGFYAVLFPVIGKRLHEIIAEIVTAIEIAFHGRIPPQQMGPLPGRLDDIIV
jgi:hypothetical protein